MNKLARRIGWVVTGLIVGGAVGFVYYIKSGIEPTAASKPFFIRFEEKTPITSAGLTLRGRGVIRNATAFRYYAIYRRYDSKVLEGTYQLAGGMTADQIFAALRRPITQMVRIPETNFSFRTAKLLAQKDVLAADDYDSLVKQPSWFAKKVSFSLPKWSLEGYLYPDTYDLPPLIGAKAVIERQLSAFEKKVYPLLKDLDETKRQRTLIIASMVELEAGQDSDRPIIAGVIENRLKKQMRLQIDATILYGMKAWRRMFNKDYQFDSPYNTYKIPGLPPGPICSPSLKSVEAALHPATHEFLYYVAKPDRNHIFAKTYEEHLANIKVARKLRDEAERKK